MSDIRIETDRRLPARGRLWLELAALYLGIPLVLLLALPPTAMFTVLGVATLIGMVLLHRTPGFAWAELLSGPPVPWRLVVLFGLATAAVAVATTLTLFPRNLFYLPKQAPLMWLVIMALYPLLSALPQELLFRPLFFRRYGALFPSTGVAVGLNAALFSLAHVMYLSPLVLAMTFTGGLVFAWAYAVRGSFALAVLLHMLAGQIVFTSGLGILFYSGAVH